MYYANFILRTWDCGLQTQSGSKMGSRCPPYQLKMSTSKAFDRGFGTFDRGFGTFDRDFGTKKWPNCFPGGFPHFRYERPLASHFKYGGKIGVKKVSKSSFEEYL